MRGEVVEEQIQWVLSYVQRGSANVWKKNILKDLEVGTLEYEMAREFLADIKKKFGGEGEETVKVVELRKLKQGGKIIEEFVQEFKRAAKESGYKERLLIKEFKREMNRTIC